MTSADREHFAAAAREYAALVAAIGNDQWSDPGLGEWDLRALVGHTSRSLVTVQTYLTQPAQVADLASPAEYLAAVVAVDPASVAERGRVAGLELGEDPAAAVATLVERVLPLVERDDDPLISTALGGMRLSHYLPTRTFELVVHGLDIALAAGLPEPDYDAALLTSVVQLAAATAVPRGQGTELLLALTGRRSLPPGFSVV